MAFPFILAKGLFAFPIIAKITCFHLELQATLVKVFEWWKVFTSMISGKKSSVVFELWDLFIKEAPVSSLRTHNLIQRYYISVEFGSKYWKHHDNCIYIWLSYILKSGKCISWAPVWRRDLWRMPTFGLDI